MSTTAHDHREVDPTGYNRKLDRVYPDVRMNASTLKASKWRCDDIDVQKRVEVNMRAVALKELSDLIAGERSHRAHMIESMVLRYRNMLKVTVHTTTSPVALMNDIEIDECITYIETCYFNKAIKYIIEKGVVARDNKKVRSDLILECRLIIGLIHSDVKQLNKSSKKMLQRAIKQYASNHPIPSSGSVTNKMFSDHVNTIILKQNSEPSPYKSWYEHVLYYLKLYI